MVVEDGVYVFRGSSESVGTSSKCEVYRIIQTSGELLENYRMDAGYIKDKREGVR